MTKMKRILTIAIVAAFTLVGVNFAGFHSDNNAAFAAPKTFIAYAYCQKCDPRHKHVYKGSSNKSTNAARENAKKKCRAAGHNKKTCKVVATTQY